MKRLFFASLTGLLFVLSCQTVPITGRQQLSIVPSGTLMSMSFNEYGDFLKKHEVITSTTDAQMVSRVGRRIQLAVERYFSEQNISDELNGYQWEFNLVKDDAV